MKIKRENDIVLMKVSDMKWKLAQLRVNLENLENCYIGHPEVEKEMMEIIEEISFIQKSFQNILDSE